MRVWEDCLEALLPCQKRTTYSKNLEPCKPFARKVIKLLTEDFWKKRISFSLDGIDFIHTKKPDTLGEACAAGAVTQRMLSESLPSTAKGKMKVINHFSDQTLALTLTKKWTTCKIRPGIMNTICKKGQSKLYQNIFGRNKSSFLLVLVLH